MQVFRRANNRQRHTETESLEELFTRKLFADRFALQLHSNHLGFPARFPRDDARLGFRRPEQNPFQVVELAAQHSHARQSRLNRGMLHGIVDNHHGVLWSQIHFPEDLGQVVDFATEIDLARRNRSGQAGPE